jgi:hypothetical protein
MSRLWRIWLSSGGSRLRLTELLLRSGTNFVKFRAQPSDLSIQFDKIQTVGRHQSVRLHSRIILFAPPPLGHDLSRRTYSTGNLREEASTSVTALRPTIP